MAYRQFYGRENAERAFRTACEKAEHERPLCAVCLVEFEKYWVNSERQLKERTSASSPEGA